MLCGRWNPSVVHRRAVACDHQYRLASRLSTSFHSVLEKETKSRNTTVTIVTKLWTGRPRNRDSIPRSLRPEYYGDIKPSYRPYWRRLSNRQSGWGVNPTTPSIQFPGLRMRTAIFYPFLWRSAWLKLGKTFCVLWKRNKDECSVNALDC